MKKDQRVRDYFLVFLNEQMGKFIYWKTNRCFGKIYEVLEVSGSAQRKLNC